MEHKLQEGLHSLQDKRNQREAKEREDYCIRMLDKVSRDKASFKEQIVSREKAIEGLKLINKEILKAYDASDYPLIDSLCDKLGALPMYK